MGDRDSKLFLEISNLDIYRQKQEKRPECVGHIQEQLRSRLRKLKRLKKEFFSNGKTLGGKSRLTDKMINKLQNYISIAIRQCAGRTVFKIKKAIGAVLFHCSEELNLDTKYQMWPREPDS